MPTIMGIQAVSLALINRLRFRCDPDENNRCVCRSGCTEHSFLEAGGIDASEFFVNDQKVLLVSSKINCTINERTAAHPVSENFHRLKICATRWDGDRD